MSDINSNRKYTILITEIGGTTKSSLTLNRMLNLKQNDFEYLYSLHEDIDKVLDLKDGESMYFQPIRDNKDSKGIIVRNDDNNLR